MWQSFQITGNLSHSPSYLYRLTFLTHSASHVMLDINRQKLQDSKLNKQKSNEDNELTEQLIKLIFGPELKGLADQQKCLLN